MYSIDIIYRDGESQVLLLTETLKAAQIIKEAFEAADRVDYPHAMKTSPWGYEIREFPKE